MYIFLLQQITISKWLKTTQMNSFTSDCKNSARNLTELNSRGQQCYAPFWKLSGRVFPCHFQLLEATHVLRGPRPSSEPVTLYLPYCSSIAVSPSHCNRKVFFDIKGS